MHRLTQGKNLAYVYCSVEKLSDGQILCLFFFLFFLGASEVALKILHTELTKKKKKVLHTADTIILWIKFCKLGAAKAKKGRKTSVDTSASEVINLNENAVSLTTLFLFMLIFILVLYYKSMPKSGFES
jgi:hypothetical protein